MPLQYRRMKPRDVDACVAIIASHPLYGPRFDGQMGLLAPAILAGLSLESVRAIVFEETLPQGTVRLMGGGAFAFVTDVFIAAAKTPPFFWIGPEMVRLISCNRSPLLSNDDLRRANASCGLNAVT